MKNSYITPNWPAPPNVKACCTTRLNGCSKNPYASFNLGSHVEDVPGDVEKNRIKLHKQLNLPSSCLWLEQVHDNKVITCDDWYSDVSADGCYCSQPKQICTIMSADCLPLLFCNKAGTEIMALHGGWRSLAAGIIAQGIKHFQSKPADILVWLGPAISSKHFEVGHEVREQFLKFNNKLADCFKPSPNERWLMDIYNAARLLLKSSGITEVYGGEHCTYAEEELFFSWRRDGQTGRMASLIYIE